MWYCLYEKACFNKIFKSYYIKLCLDQGCELEAFLIEFKFEFEFTKKLQVRVRVRIRVHKKIASSSSSFVLINLINYFTRIRISSLVKHEVITIYNILGRTLINLFYTYQIFYPG